MAKDAGGEVSLPPEDETEDEVDWAKCLRVARATAWKVLARSWRRYCEADVQDVAAETLLLLLEWMAQTGGRPSQKAFTFCALNATKYLWPHRTRGRMGLCDEVPEVPTPFDDEAAPMETAHKLAAVQRLHQALSPDNQRLLTLRLAGWEPAEMAAETGLSIFNVCERVRRIEGYLAQGTLPPPQRAGAGGRRGAKRGETVTCASCPATITGLKTYCPTCAAERERSRGKRRSWKKP